GAQVAEVVAESPAENPGMKAGDVIVSYNGQAIDRTEELPPLVGRVPAGGTAELDVVREGQRQRIQVTIAELPDDGQAQAAPGGGAAAPSNLLGVTVEALTEQQLKEAGIDSGVLITGVSEGPGRVAGLQPGDILRRLNNQALRSVADFEKALAGLPRDKAIPMLVVRQGNPSFMVIKIPSE
ncbi:MAG: PDZ domain-containing protein, partial [Gammaproteobacteria bacterium]|nr:PDZ domain-containing protein [Gammaproteobacteria bacterium]